MTATITAPGSVAEQSSWAEVGPWVIHARHWVRHGEWDTEPLVLVHGFGVGGRMCRPTAERLSTHLPVHAPDLPGFAESSKPEATLDIPDLADALAAWMDQVHLPPANLVGVSFGSLIAAEVARRHPEAVRHLGLVSPIVDSGRRNWPTQIGRWQLERFTQSLRLQAIQLADMPRSGPRRLLRSFSHALDYRLEDTVADIAHPTLVCWGARDPLVSRDFAEQVAQRAPDGTLAVLPTATHAMSHDSALELSRVLIRFIDPDRLGPKHPTKEVTS